VTTRAALRALVDGEKSQFVDLVMELTPEEWEAPSLCAGLSVRDVVVHVAAHIHHGPSNAEVTRAVVRSGFSVSRAGRILDRDQRAHHSWRSNANLVEWLSSPIEDSPPGDLQLQLSEMVIHQ